MMRTEEGKLPVIHWSEHVHALRKLSEAADTNVKVLVKSSEELMTEVKLSFAKEVENQNELVSKLMQKMTWLNFEKQSFKRDFEKLSTDSGQVI